MEKNTLWQRCEALGPQREESISLEQYGKNWVVYLNDLRGGHALAVIRDAVIHPSIHTIIADAVLQRFEAMALKDNAAVTEPTIAQRQWLYGLLYKSRGVSNEVYEISVDSVPKIFIRSKADRSRYCIVYPKKYGYEFNDCGIDFVTACKTVGYDPFGIDHDTDGRHRDPNSKGALHEPLPMPDEQQRLASLWQNMHGDNIPIGLHVVSSGRNGHVATLMNAGRAICDLYSNQVLNLTNGHTLKILDPEWTLERIETQFDSSIIDRDAQVEALKKKYPQSDIVARREGNVLREIEAKGRSGYNSEPPYPSTVTIQLGEINHLTEMPQDLQDQLKTKLESESGKAYQVAFIAELPDSTSKDKFNNLIQFISCDDPINEHSEAKAMSKIKALMELERIARASIGSNQNAASQISIIDSLHKTKMP